MLPSSLPVKRGMLHPVFRKDVLRALLLPKKRGTLMLTPDKDDCPKPHFTYFFFPAENKVC